MSANNKLGVLALTLLITGAIDSIRNLPAAALFGSTLIFFFLFSAIVLLIPAALVSAELAANIDEGGIYQWVRIAFGERIGFLAIWLQWIGNLVWMPTILSFIAGTAAYLIDPALAQNKYYLVTVMLSIFWVLTLINLKGLHVSAKFTSFCAVIGLIIPMVLIIGLFILWMILGKPLQMHITSANILPNLQHKDNWIALTAIMTSFLGMELATVHIKDVHNPQKTFPKALAISTAIILATMVLGSLAIAYVLPYNQISLINGTIETFSYFLSAYHLSWLTPVLTVLLVIGTLGGIISWVISPAKGLAQAAQYNFLPAIFTKQNKHGVSQNILLMQAVIFSIMCLAFILLPSVNGSYWLLTALSTQLTMVMYILMFLTVIVLRKKTQHQHQTFRIPGGKIGLWITSLLGLSGCSITFFVGFIPPGNINIGSNIAYELTFCLGMAAMVAPVFLFYLYQSKSNPAELQEDVLATSLT